MISRRRFLRSTLLGGVLLGGAGLLWRHAGGYAVAPEVAARLKVLTPKEWLVVEAAAARLLAPDAADAPRPETMHVGLFVDGYLARLDAGMQDDVKMLLLLLEHGSGMFRLSSKRFTRMSADEQDATLADWEGSRLAVRRQGFQALKTMCLLAYWRDDRTWPLLGYTGPMLPKRGGG